MTNDSLIFYCREGFEADTAEEAVQWLEGRGIRAQGESRQGDAYAVLDISRAVPFDKLRNLPFRDLIFARQGTIALRDMIELPQGKRAGPIADAARTLAARFGLAGFQAVWLEYPDTNVGKALSPAARRVTPFIEEDLRASGLLKPDDSRLPRLHVFLLPDSTARVACSYGGRSSDWPLGIPRLRMPSGAPSRSTLKFAEAIMAFLGEDAEKMLMPDMRAVDLGAAPGGWTWQLIHRGVRVTAVDNANLRGELVDNALVKHLRSDGFHYEPKRPVDWLVCDMLEKPSRIATLVAKWMGNGWAQRAIFNLKLPMKKRLEEVARCTEILEEGLRHSSNHPTLKFKHLYHDREEVTAYCSILRR